LVRVSNRTSWVVNFALFRCYRPVIYTRPWVYIAVTSYKLLFINLVKNPLHISFKSTDQCVFTYTYVNEC